MTVLGVRRIGKLSMALVALGGGVVLAGCGGQQKSFGPQCAAVDAATFAANSYKPRDKLNFEYREVIFQRALGNVDCQDVNSGGLGFQKHGVCIFTGPAVLDVRTPDGQHAYYTPGVGKQVVVTIKDGGAKCEQPA